MNTVGNITFKLVVAEDICRHCGRCLGAEVCRGSAFRRFDRDDAPFIDMSRCWGCLKCMVTCPFGAIQRIDYSER